MKKIISIVFLLVLLVAGGLVLGPSMVDWNKYKPEIVSQLQALTGHEYTIAGNIELAIVPMPRVKIEGLSVAMPQALGGAVIASLDRAAVNVALMPLMHRQIVVKSVELVKPVFNLGVRADGTAIWMTPELQAKLDASKIVPTQPRREVGNAFGNAISLNEVRITGGSFSYSDASKNSKTSLDKIDLDIEGGSLFGPYKIEGQVSYNDQPVKLSIKTTKVSDFNAAIPLQAQFNLAQGGTVITYSGVVATKPALELQGETGFKTNNVAEVLKALNGTADAALAKPVRVTGILTYNAAGVDYKNVALNISGTDATGSVSLRNLTKAAGQPLDVTLALKSDKALLDEMIPPQSSAKETKKGGFIPDSVALPMDMRVKAEVTVRQAEYRGATFNDIILTANLAEKNINGIFKATTPGQGKVDTSYKLAAGSVSRNDKGGTLLSDLVLSLDGSVQASVPQALVKPFVAAEALKGAGTLLSTPATAVFKLNVAPALASITTANINILDTELTIGGSYKPGINAGRALLTATLSAGVIDGDAWLSRLQPPTQAATQPALAVKSGKIDIAGMAKKLELPMDIDVSLSIADLKLYEQAYDKVAFKGRLIGNKLTIDTAGLEATGGNSLTLAGSVGDVTALKDVDLTAKGKTPDTLKTLQGFKVDTRNFPASIGPSEVLAEFKGQPDNLSFVANAKALKGTLEASGVLDDLMSEPKVSNLTARVKHPNYVELARLFNPDFKSSVGMDKNLDVYASMARQGSVYTLKDFQATLGPSTITGQVSFDTGGARPKLNATLSAGDLALSDIMGVEKKTKGTVQAASPAADNVRWSRNAINVDWMRKYDAEVKVTAKSLSWVTWRLDNAVLESKLDNGTLDISRLNGGLYGGTVNAHAKLVAPPDDRAPLGVTAGAKLSDVSLESFVSSFSGSQLVKARGSVNLDADVQTAGISPAALVFGLKGKGVSTGKDIVFDGFDLARVSRTLIQPSSSLKENVVSLLDSSMAGGQTAFSTLDGSFTITEGVIDFEKLLLTGEAATVNTTGHVNLPLWTVDLESSIKLAEPADAPALKTSFRGPLDNPGKTFGRSALDSYIGNQLQKAIGDAVMDKLQDKGIMDKLPAGAAAPQNAGEVIQNLIQQKIMPKAKGSAGSTITPSTPLSPMTIPPAVTPAAPSPAAPAPTPAPTAAAETPVTTAPLPVAPAPVIEAAPAAEPDLVPAPTVTPEVAPPAMPEAAVPAQPESAPAPVTATPEAASEAAPAATKDPIGNLIEDLTKEP